MQKYILLLFWLVCDVDYLFAHQSVENEIQQQIQHAPDSATKIDLCFKAGKIYSNDADFVSALDYYFKGLRLAEKNGDEYRKGSAYNNISIAYIETGKYEQAEQFAQKAIEIFKHFNNDKELGTSYNSLGNIFYLQARDSLALNHYFTSLRYRHLAKDSAGLFATYKNLGALHHAMGDTLNSIKFMEQSLNYLTAKDDSLKWFSAFMTIGELYVYIGKLEKGKEYLDKASRFKSAIAAYHKLDDYHHALYRYYYTKGNFESALDAYIKFEEYKDSVENIEKNKQLMELNVQYETEKKEDLIKHQRQLIEKEQQGRRLYLLLLLLSLILLGALFFIYRTHQKHKTDLLLRQQNEKALQEIFNAEQKERIRIARDLHDSIGQKLAVMRMILPKAEGSMELEKIKDYLDETANEVRNISHNLIPEILNFGLVKAIEHLTDRINSTENIRVAFTADEQIQKITLPKQTELSLYRIIQEILSNILRHSKTEHLKIELTSESNFVRIAITDNGVGFSTETIDESKGLGWKNIFARIKLINGSIKIQSEKNKGSQFLINIPIA